MCIDSVNVLGAGGHGRVIIDTLQMLGYAADKIQVRDDQENIQGRGILGFTIECPVVPPSGLDGLVHAAVGEPTIRQLLLERSGVPVERWLTILHPFSCVASSVFLEAASFIAAGAIVGPCVHLGHGSIVNHGAVVDHDCQVGAFSHIAPCASLGGGVKVGERVLIGGGARVLSGLNIGDDAIIGAGAVVLNDVAPGQTWVGVPARQANKG